MFHVSKIRFIISIVAMVVMISSSGWLEAQEQQAKEAANEDKAQETKPAQLWVRPSTESVKLPKKVTKQLVNEIVPAIRAGNDNAFLTAAMPLIRTIKPEALDALDKLSKVHGVQAVQSRFVDLVLEHVEQGHDPTQVVADIKMARIVFKGLVTRLNEFAEKSLNHEVMQDPLEVPEGFQESERLFWNIHVLHNEFQNVGRSIQFGRAILNHHQQKMKRDGEGERLAADLAKVEAGLVGNHNSVLERAAKLRLQRFEQAHKHLSENADADFESKLTSAMAMEQDGSVLLSFLKSKPANLTLDSLKADGLESRIEKMLESGRAAAGEVSTHANLFRNGLHYWTRGRYGSGPQVLGLVKHPSSMKSHQAMEALYMPRVRNKPISDYHSEEESSPGYERRHYYTWAAEYRPIVAKTGGISGTRDRTTREYGPSILQNKQKFL